MVKFVTINKTVMVDDTDNEVEYIKTNSLNLEQTSTIRVKQEDEDSEPLSIDIRDRSEEESSANELDDMEEQEEEEGKEELLGMPDIENCSDQGNMLITHNKPPSHFPGRTLE